MDSLSQMLLGAAVAHVVLCIPGRSPASGVDQQSSAGSVDASIVPTGSGGTSTCVVLLVGALLGTLPDLDVLVPYDDAVASFTYHRSWSHSLLVLSAASLPLALLLSAVFARMRWPVQASVKRWWLAVWLVLVTHPLLDGLTIYGTQLFWPLPVKPVGIGSIFIIDLLYTLPLLVAVVWVWRQPKSTPGRWVMPGALAISTGYLVWTLMAQAMVGQRLERQMAADGLTAERLVVAPFPFSLLWRVVVVTENDYFEGFTSLVDRDTSIELFRFDSGRAACASWLTHWPVKRMDWFTDGAIAIQRRDNQLVVTDLRMGIEDDYVFEFAVGDWQSGEWKMQQSTLLPMAFDTSRVKSLFVRMVDQSVDMHAPLRQSRVNESQGSTC